MYHSTVMRSEDDDEEERERERQRRERSINGPGASSPNTTNTTTTTRPFNAPSPTQPSLHSSTYSPTNGAQPRTQYINPYHPPSPSPLPMTTPSSHISGAQASPRILTAPSPYQSEYQPVPRDKPTSNYYDPTSDSSERRPSESAARSESQNTTSQVRGE